MRHLLRGIALLVGVGLIGCYGQNRSTPADSKAASATPAAGPQPVSVPANASPDHVVTVFLNALRSGDSATTESLLTAKAREELAKHQLAVDVQSAPNATYQVRPAEILAENTDGAHVKSIWTEKYADGDQTYEIIWVLRRQTEGWRLAGMAMQLLPGQDPQYLNFEDPSDMLRKRDAAMAAMQQADLQTAQQPQQPATNPPPAIER
jgi:hypothetical protein